MFDEDKKKSKTTAKFEYFPPEFVLIVRKELIGKLQTRELFKFAIYVVNVFVFVQIVSHAKVCTTQKIIYVWTVWWRLKKRAPPKKFVLLLFVFRKYMIWTVTFVYHLSIQRFQFCPVIGLHCLGGPGFSSCSVTNQWSVQIFFWFNLFMLILCDLHYIIIHIRLNLRFTIRCISHFKTT